MRILLPLLLLSASLYAVPFESNAIIFPPDPMRSLEDLKMKPMVSHYFGISSSGSHMVTGMLTAEHRTRTKDYITVLDGYWINQWDVSETYKMKDYKYR